MDLSRVSSYYCYYFHLGDDEIFCYCSLNCKQSFFLFLVSIFSPCMVAQVQICGFYFLVLMDNYYESDRYGSKGLSLCGSLSDIWLIDGRNHGSSNPLCSDLSLIPFLNLTKKSIARDEFFLIILVSSYQRLRILPQRKALGRMTEVGFIKKLYPNLYSFLLWDSKGERKNIFFFCIVVPDAALAKVATEKRLSLIKAWEENEKVKAENK